MKVKGGAAPKSTKPVVVLAGKAKKKKFKAGDPFPQITSSKSNAGVVAKTPNGSKKRKRPRTESVGENWKKLQKKKQSGPLVHYGREAPPTTNSMKVMLPTTNQPEVSSSGSSKKTESSADRDKYVAMDCEMVGVGTGGKRSVLARCSVVNYDEEVLYDKFVQCVEHITDFRKFCTNKNFINALFN